MVYRIKYFKWCEVHKVRKQCPLTPLTLRLTLHFKLISREQIEISILSSLKEDSDPTLV